MDATKTESTVAELRAARVAGDFTRYEVAQKLGLSQSTLNRIEEGQKAVPDLRSFAAEYWRALHELDQERRGRMLAVASQPSA